jgi:hypothetical protein
MLWMSSAQFSERIYTLGEVADARWKSIYTLGWLADGLGEPFDGPQGRSYRVGERADRLWKSIVLLWKSSVALGNTADEANSGIQYDGRNLRVRHPPLHRRCPSVSLREFCDARLIACHPEAGAARRGTSQAVGHYANEIRPDSSGRSSENAKAKLGRFVLRLRGPSPSPRFGMTTLVRLVPGRSPP